jgi:hypothetical protein
LLTEKSGKLSLRPKEENGFRLSALHSREIGCVVLALFCQFWTGQAVLVEYFARTGTQPSRWWYLKEHMLSSLRAVCLFAVTLFAASVPVLAQAGQFDLLGPTIEVKVNRAGRTLPIAEVPALAEGDRIWLHPVLADKQAVRYLMVAAFLRGSTNPPPEEWFTKAETWDKKVIDEGIYITVPPGAQQAIVFLAPETGGDFSTLKNAVRGRPGSFVRASQDLNEASLDRARLDDYLDSLKKVDDPAKIKETSAMLGRSLALKVDQQCFDRASDQQAPCLLQNQDQLILDNGRSQTIASTLTNGPTSDLALQAGAAPQANYGYYNSYIAAAMDIAKILDNFHTAQYQYIPALSSDNDLTMTLRLNTPPSFHNPKSVIVVALPPVEAPEPPPLHAVDAKQVLCMEREPLVLPVEGAPAVFATDFAHGLTLHLDGKDGKSLDLPAKPDAALGGFVVPVDALAKGDLGSEVRATVHGFWGFEPYTGPTFKLESTNDTNWVVAEADRNALVVGREDELHLSSPSAACVDEVSFKDAQGKETKATWKLTKPDEITAKLPLKDAQPGEMTLEIAQAGAKDPHTLTVASFSEAGKFENFSMHAGDKSGTLKGTRLDEVATLTLGGVSFTPDKLTRAGTTDELTLATAGAPAAKAGKAAAAPRPGDHLTAQITLKDGRKLDVPAAISVARPQIVVLNKRVQLAQPGSPVAAHIQLADANELPLDGKLTFALKSQTPSTFARGESVEIASEDGMVSVTLSLSSGDLVLQDAKTAIATLDPMKAFGASAFGPLQVRPTMADGTVGDWQPLATLVRLPTVASVNCPPDPAASCSLSGSSLFLIDSVASDAQFSKAVSVPDGFAGSTLDVPHMAGGSLFVKLRDDPNVVNKLALDVPVTASKTTAARLPRVPGPPHRPDTTTAAVTGSGQAPAAGGGMPAPGTPAPASGTPSPATEAPLPSPQPAQPPSGVPADGSTAPHF